MIPQQQEISAQVWICHDCGGHDPKSCGCAGATAYSELAAKREQDRVRAKAYRERKAASRDAPVDKIGEMPTAEEAEESFQETLYDQACLFLERMTGETRQRLFAYLCTKYNVAIIEAKVATS